MPRKYTTSAVSTEVLWSLLQGCGASDATLTDQTGIDPSVLQSPEKRIPMSQYLRLWELAIEATGNPALGLHLRAYYNPGQSHFVTSIFFSSATAFDGLKQWIRYYSLLSDADRFELKVEANFVTLVYSNISAALGNPWIPELYFSLITGQIQRAIGKELVAEEVWMAHPAPAYANEYQSVFNTKLQFEQNEYHIRWKRESLNIPLKTHDPYYQSILKKYADDAMHSSGGTESFRSIVRQTIVDLLPRNEADIQRVADTYHMDRRTLLRKLKAEGTTFKDLLESTRKQLALDFLGQGLSLTQISFMLGFTATSSFQVAFKRWYKQSPGEYRRRLGQMGTNRE